MAGPSNLLFFRHYDSLKKEVAISEEYPTSTLFGAQIDPEFEQWKKYNALHLYLSIKIDN